MTYAEVDRLLYMLVDERQTIEACIKAGFARSMVRKVVERMQRNQYKRMPPIIAKLSQRTVGYDFLYMRDEGS